MDDAHSLLHDAEKDITRAKFWLNLPASIHDEINLNNACFCISRAVFDCIEAQFIIQKHEVPYMREIDFMIRQGYENDIKIYIPQYIIDHSDTFEKWFEKALGRTTFLTYKQKAEKALQAAQEFLEQLLPSSNKELAKTA